MALVVALCSTLEVQRMDGLISGLTFVAVVLILVVLVAVRMGIVTQFSWRF